MLQGFLQHPFVKNKQVTFITTVKWLKETSNKKGNALLMKSKKKKQTN